MTTSKKKDKKIAGQNLFGYMPLTSKNKIQIG